MSCKLAFLTFPEMSYNMLAKVVVRRRHVGLIAGSGRTTSLRMMLLDVDTECD